MKKLFFIFMCFVSFSCFAAPFDLMQCAPGAPCPFALQTNDPGFCPSFVKAAQCQCVNRGGLPPSLCQDMTKIYNRMIALYKTIPAACSAQHDVSTQECIDDWMCYLNGGNDSKQRPCSSTGKSCK